MQDHRRDRSRCRARFAGRKPRPNFLYTVDARRRARLLPKRLASEKAHGRDISRATTPLDDDCRERKRRSLSLDGSPRPRPCGHQEAVDLQLMRRKGFAAPSWPRRQPRLRRLDQAPIPGPHVVYGFLTTAPNAVVEPIHPKAMPEIPNDGRGARCLDARRGMRRRRCNGRCRSIRARS